jgi:hypothetical protein
MKKIILALVVLTVLSVPAFAGDFSLAGSIDFGGGYSYAGDAGTIGITAHFAWQPIKLLNNALTIGPGASFELPIRDPSTLAIYALGQIYPLRISKAGGAGWYINLRLGFNLPLLNAADFGGGFYYGIGTGFDFTKTVFAEFMYVHYALSYDIGAYSWSASYGVAQLAIGVRF